MPVVNLFFEALPCWRTGAMGECLQEGFDRAQVQALFDLRAIRRQERAEMWDYLSHMESVYRELRSEPETKPDQPNRIIKDLD
jgi:hypothetical protein